MGPTDAALAEYKRLFNTVTDAIYIQDRAGVFLDVNEAVVRMYGYERDEVIGKTPAMLAAPDRVDLEDTFAKVEKAFDGEPQRFEWWGRRKDGEVFPKEIVLTAGRFRERDVVIALARDISERKRAEEALRAAEARQADAERLRALGQLAAGVAHDFNNALTAILGYAQVMRRRTDDPEFIAEGLEVIEQAARGASVTARRVQSFGREPRSDEMTSIDLAAPLREAVAMTSPRWERDAAARGIVYEVDVDLPEEPLPVSGNDAELREVFVNLLLNAVDAMPEGGRVEVAAWRDPEQVYVEVRDRGPGLDEQTRRRIFEPFFSTKGERGTGLGLSVSHGIVRRHGGEIRVASEPRRGATFRVVLPRERESQRLQAVTASEPRHSRILLVDDERVVRGALVELLEEMGHRVVDVPDATSALELLDRASFDLLMADLSMPEMAGSELVTRTRAGHPRTKVVVVTGYADEQWASPAVTSAHALVRKPVDRTTLANVLTRVLGQREAARA